MDNSEMKPTDIFYPQETAEADAISTTDEVITETEEETPAGSEVEPAEARGVGEGVPLTPALPEGLHSEGENRRAPEVR